MAVRYYADGYDRIRTHPLLDFGILPTIRHFIHSFLYPEDSPASFSLDSADYPKFRLADIDAQSAFEEQQAFLNLQNEILPFTAFNIGEWVENEERKNHNAKSFNYYSSCYDAYITTRPIQIEIPMISFFATASDYYHARSILHEINMSYTQLYAPISINGTNVSVPFSIGLEISKGTYAGEFEEQLNSGSISDVVHTMTIDFWDIWVDTDGVAPVESFQFDIYSGEYPSGTLLESNTYSGYPEVSSTTPADDATDVAVDADITITFNESMYVDTVEDGISVSPYFEYDISFNDDETIFTLSLREDLDNDTTYTITIDETAKGVSLQELMEDYDFSFTTEAS